MDSAADKDKTRTSAMQAALDGKADVSHKHTISDITDMPEYLTEETDPTVPAWAKQAEKPVYTADEVGAAAEQHKHSTADITDFPAIPTKVSDLQNDRGDISVEAEPTVPARAQADEKPTNRTDISIFTAHLRGGRFRGNDSLYSFPANEDCLCQCGCSFEIES